MLKNYFKLDQLNTDVRTEVLAGVTTFLTMSYIIFVNPNTLGQTTWYDSTFNVRVTP